MAPYAFPSTLLQKSLTQTSIKFLWAFWDGSVNWMLVAVKMILYARFVSDAIRRRIKKYNHHQQIPSSASHFFAKDSMLVQSRWLHKPFVAPLCLCLWRATYSTPHNPSTLALLLNVGQGGIPGSLKCFNVLNAIPKLPVPGHESGQFRFWVDKPFVAPPI
jgi:hypothetical protein